MFSVESKIKRKYHLPKESIYCGRFLSDLSSGYSFTFGKKSDNCDFISIEPDDCVVNSLLNGHHRSHNGYQIEQIIDKTAYSLMAYGSAYIQIHPEYSIMRENDGTVKKVLSSFEIHEMKGIIIRKSKEQYIFCRKGYNASLDEMKIPKNELVILDIREVGFSKLFFPGILKKLSKCDIPTMYKDIATDHSIGYDWVYILERKKIAELKALRKTGWSFGTEKLSDSYIMFKKIQEDKLKIRFLEYIIKRINEGICGLLGNNAGELVAHINKKDYEQLWNDYSTGRITGTELTNVLYNVDA